MGKYTIWMCCRVFASERNLRNRQTLVPDFLGKLASPIQLSVWLRKLCPTVFELMLQGFCFIVGISCVPNIGKVP